MNNRSVRKSDTTEYISWCGMKIRCLNPRNPAWPDYGGRGIKVCDRWVNSFDNFLADMGMRPSPGHSIDRIDNDGDYSPTNCRWATEMEQQSNSRHCLFIEAHGLRLTMTEWSRRTGLDRGTIKLRIKKGLRNEALVAPAYGGRVDRVRTPKRLLRIAIARDRAARAGK